MVYYVCKIKKQKKGDKKMENKHHEKLREMIFNSNCTMGEILDYINSMNDLDVEILREEVSKLLTEYITKIRPNFSSPKDGENNGNSSKNERI